MTLFALGLLWLGLAGAAYCAAWFVRVAVQGWRAGRSRAQWRGR